MLGFRKGGCLWRECFQQILKDREGQLCSESYLVVCSSTREVQMSTVWTKTVLCAEMVMLDDSQWRNAGAWSRLASAHESWHIILSDRELAVDGHHDFSERCQLWEELRWRPRRNGWEMGYRGGVGRVRLEVVGWMDDQGVTVKQIKQWWEVQRCDGEVVSVVLSGLIQVSVHRRSPESWFACLEMKSALFTVYCQVHCLHKPLDGKGWYLWEINLILAQMET